MLLLILTTVASLMRILKTTTTTQGIFFSYRFDADLIFLFPKELTMLPCFFSPPLFFYFTSPPMTPLPFLCLLLSSHLIFIQPQTPLVSSHPPPPRLSVCKVGFYRSLLESLACSKCPPHSMARQAGSTACSCEDGYYKIDSDPPNMACTCEDICIYYIWLDYTSSQFLPMCFCSWRYCKTRVASISFRPSLCPTQCHLQCQWDKRLPGVVRPHGNRRQEGCALQHPVQTSSSRRKGLGRMRPQRALLAAPRRPDKHLSDGGRPAVTH